MTEYKRPKANVVSRQLPGNDEDMISGDKRELIPDTLSGLEFLPDGSWYGISRPLADDYGVPGRGVEGHGTDSDTESMDYQPNPAGDAQFDADDGRWRELKAPSPLYVTTVPDPLKSVIKGSITRTFIGPSHDFRTVPFTAVDFNNVFTVGRDESRVKLTLVVGANLLTAAANQSLKYTFAVSHDAQFPLGNFVILDTAIGTQYEFLGTEPLYVGLWSVAAQDATKQNTLVLNAIIERQGMVDYQPSRVPKS